VLHIPLSTETKKHNSHRLDCYHVSHDFFVQKHLPWAAFRQGDQTLSTIPGTKEKKKNTESSSPLYKDRGFLVSELSIWVAFDRDEPWLGYMYQIG
jgi:hypothetical protein